MNDSDPSPINLDELRLLPDWLRHEGPPPSKQYASHDGGDDESRRGPRAGSFERKRDGGRAFGGGGERRRDGGGSRRPGPGPRGGGKERGRPPREERPPAPVVAAPVRVEFLPDEKCMASIIKQIRATHLAYPLFGLARMFLQEPARHWVQFTIAPEAGSLFQLGEEGPVVVDRTVLERIAFDKVKDDYYTEQSEQKEPPKGNFSNVARNRLSGALLGPTNYHGYQPALRAEYESRFSRRMSFDDYRRNIEVVSDPTLVERWKEEARTTTTISTREGEPPTTLQSPSEARAHFRQHYLDGLVRAGTTFKVHGSIARALPESSMMQAIRQAHDAELRYPAQFVQLLRQGLQNAGLHIFKHRKRVVYVSIARPVPFAPEGVVSENVAAILETVRQFPLCTRKTIAEKVLAAPAVPVAETPAAEPLAEDSAPTPAPADDASNKAKATLAADLRFLVQSGHLIEFHNGTFDLPLSPKAKEEPENAASPETPASVMPDVNESAAMEVASADETSTPSPASDPTEAAPTATSDAVGTDGPGIASDDHHDTSPDPVVVGDVESAHPSSPS